MRLTIRHVTRYAYEEAPFYTTQYLRLTPREIPGQRVVDWKITAPGNLVPWVDGFDNPAHVLTFGRTPGAVDIRVDGTVETRDTSGIVPANDGLDPSMFLRGTHFTRLTDGIAAFAAPFVAVRDSDGPIPALHSLTGAIADAVAYEGGATTVETNAATALELGRGVCQDHAHLFIAGARALGIPARYVSGYVLAGEGNESHLASHAWAEAHVPELGWVSFDPSNRQSATDAYVRLAIGFDHLGAAPVRGVRMGGGEESMDVRVQVQQSQ